MAEIEVESELAVERATEAEIDDLKRMVADFTSTANRPLALEELTHASFFTTASSTKSSTGWRTRRPLAASLRA